MFSFKRSLIALVGLLVIVGTLAALMPLVSRGQGDVKNPLNRDPRRSFYLTQTLHNGSQALTACASGYHMASLWEILDPSNLHYNSELGYTTTDSGSGPPVEHGYARTGRFALDLGNCEAWTSSSAARTGSLFRLAFVESTLDPVSPISPWIANQTTCSTTLRVWCMQD
jgi:hypothetical protein